MKTKKSSEVMTSMILVYLAGTAVGMSMSLRASWMFWLAPIFAISGAWVAGDIRQYLIRIERRDAQQRDEATSPALELLRQIRPIFNTFGYAPEMIEKIDAVLANTGKPTQQNHD